MIKTCGLKKKSAYSVIIMLTAFSKMMSSWHVDQEELSHLNSLTGFHSLYVRLQIQSICVFGPFSVVTSFIWAKTKIKSKFYFHLRFAFRGAWTLTAVYNVYVHILIVHIWFWLEDTGFIINKHRRTSLFHFLIQTN